MRTDLDTPQYHLGLANIPYSIVAAFLMMLLLPTCLGQARTFEQLKFIYSVKCETIESTKRDALALLRSNYVKALERTKSAPQKAGQLEAVLRIEEEIGLVKASGTALPSLPEDSSSQIRSMRGIYVKQMQEFERKWASDRVIAADKMGELLDQKIIELTKADDLDAAKTAKQFRDTLDAEPVLSARALLYNVNSSGASRAALRIKRHGDNIEVLVRFDGRGKISMDSPIEAVRGKSGKSGAKLKATTKTLGEFVGAKGYTVDPFVSYHQVFDGEDVGILAAWEFVRKYRQKVDGEKAMGLTLVPAPKNPHCSIATLPELENKGSFRITCRYFIPKSNDALIGFYFRHAAGRTIGSKRFEQKGKWIVSDAVDESSYQSKSLVFYPLIAEGKQFVDVKGEQIFLNELRVDHIKFTAIVTALYKRDGKPLELDIPARKILVANGKFTLSPRELNQLLETIE